MWRAEKPYLRPFDVDVVSAGNREECRTDGTEGVEKDIRIEGMTYGMFHFVCILEVEVNACVQSKAAVPPLDFWENALYDTYKFVSVKGKGVLRSYHNAD